MYDLTVNYDGACAPVNPGGTASWGIVAKNAAGETVMSAHGITGSGRGMSNNVAEYDALCHALQLVEDMAAPGWKVLVLGDSKMTVEQINGRWRVRKGLYRAKFLEAQALLVGVLAANIEVDVEWCPREENHEADLQSTRALAMANVRLFVRPRKRCVASGGAGWRE